MVTQGDLPEGILVELDSTKFTEHSQKAVSFAITIYANTYKDYTTKCNCNNCLAYLKLAAENCVVIGVMSGIQINTIKLNELLDTLLEENTKGVDA